MKHVSLFPVLAISLAVLVPVATTAGAAPSLVSEVVAGYQPKPAEGAGGRAAAAAAFLESLNAERKAEALLPLDSPERAKWTNVPPRGPQGGVRLGDLDRGQLEKACDFLASALSKAGYKQATGILLADDQLLRGGRPRPGFGAENYWLAVFGTPHAEAPWAMQLDGHHLAINMTFAGERTCYSPSFIGTQPAKIEVAGAGFEVMGGERSKAFALVRSLDEEQRRKAIRGGSRGRIAAGAGRDGHVPEQVGVSCASFNAGQKGKLLELLREWVSDLPAPAAERRMEQLQAELGETSFAWHGPTEPGSDVSYRIQGPTLIVEYSCQDLGGDPLNHLHSIYRDPTNEYGRKLLGAK